MKRKQVYKVKRKIKISYIKEFPYIDADGDVWWDNKDFYSTQDYSWNECAKSIRKATKEESESYFKARLCNKIKDFVK